MLVSATSARFSLLRSRNEHWNEPVLMRRVYGELVKAGKCGHGMRNISLLNSYAAKIA